ncbi:MAG TPA: MFS transporter [Pseudonocardiaceae bacterium]
MRRVLPDLTPWRTSKDFRLLWSSGLITNVGSSFALIALPLQAKLLTGSAVAVGALGAAELVPIIVFSLYGGVLADAMDRRKLAVLTEIAFCVVSVVSLVNSLLPHPMLWWLYVAVALGASLQGLQQPATSALLPRLVPPEQLNAAIALGSVQWTVQAVVGPALGGFVVATWGPAVGYAVDLATFVVSVLLLTRLRPVPASGDVDRVSLRHIMAGCRYAFSRSDLVGTYLVDMAAMGLAVPTSLFPFLADDLHAPWALGLLYTAPSVGNLVATAASGLAAKVHRHGRLVVLGFVVYGGALALAGLTGRLWLVLCLLAVAGAGNFVGDLARVTIWLESVPDRLRGRVAGVELLTSAVGPSLGELRGGLVAGQFGVRTALTTGGVAGVAAICLLGLALPGLWRYDSRTVRAQEPAARGPGITG